MSMVIFRSASVSQINYEREFYVRTNRLIRRYKNWNNFIFFLEGGRLYLRGYDGWNGV
jgi:hypothetical protein